MEKILIVIYSILLPLFSCAQLQNFKVSLTTGVNVGFMSSRGEYALETSESTFPALHFGATTFLKYEDYMFETGLSIEGTVFKDEFLHTGLTGLPEGKWSSYEVASYLATPLIVYPTNFPVGLHMGMKPKFEMGSAFLAPDPGGFDDKNDYHPINYLAPFQIDALVGISVPVSFMRFSLRYERGLLNRLANSPDYKEYDNQFKLLVNFMIYRSNGE